MKTLSFHDAECLSAYLDGQLSRAERARLEKRLSSNPELAAALADLRQARTMLRRTPQRRAPRNFTLTPKMAGIKPPVPRLVPALSWASAVAALAFLFTLGTNLVGNLSFGIAAPMMAAAPSGMGGGGAPDTAQAEAYGIGGGPTATPLPMMSMNAQETPVVEAPAMLAPEDTPPADTRSANPATSAQKAGQEPVKIWLYIWPGLALVLICAALLIRWINQLAFKKRLSKK